MWIGGIFKDLKYKYAGLAIELSRQCNKKCLHCMNGEAQDVTISKQIIDRVFEDTDDCDTIAIVGGEPLLHIEMLEYLIEKIIRSGWQTKNIQMTTNGTIRDGRVIRILNRFCRSGRSLNRSALLRISNDMYHDQSEYKSAMNFYKSLAISTPEIEVKFTGGINTLRISGRATNLIESDPGLGSKFFLGGQTLRNHRIKIVNGKVSCLIRISANGNVGFEEGQDFETIDALAFGNILSCSMSDAVNENNNRCLLTCEDSTKLHYVRNWKYTYNSQLNIDTQTMENIRENRFIEMLISRNAELILGRILRLRELAHKLYPFVPTQMIIELIPFPEEVVSYVMSVAPQILKESDAVIWADIEKYIDAETLTEFFAFQNASQFFKQAGICLIRLLTLFNNEKAHIEPKVLLTA